MDPFLTLNLTWRQKKKGAREDWRLIPTPINKKNKKIKKEEACELTWRLIPIAVSHTELTLKLIPIPIIWKKIKKNGRFSHWSDTIPIPKSFACRKKDCKRQTSLAYRQIRRKKKQIRKGRKKKEEKKKLSLSDSLSILILKKKHCF